MQARPHLQGLSGGALLRYRTLIRLLTLIPGRTAYHAYPDQTLANDLLHDIHPGINIGFSENRYGQIYDNHLSATTGPEAVARELERELSLNRKIGPFLTPPFANFVGSPMGAILKKRSMPAKWRIIHDLSWPAAHSINDGIPKKMFFFLPTTHLTTRSRNLNFMEKVH